MAALQGCPAVFFVTSGFKKVWAPEPPFREVKRSWKECLFAKTRHIALGSL
jgi:hypothetical protein